MDAFKVFAHWDREAEVWWAESSEIKGLAAETDTMEGLVEELRHIVPELLHLNHGIVSQPVEVQLIADRIEGMRVPA